MFRPRIFHVILLGKLETNCELEAKMGQPSSINKHIRLDNILCRHGQKHPQQKGTTHKVIQFQLVRLQTSEGRHSPLDACHTVPLAVSVLHGRWSTANNSDGSKNALATSIILSLLQEIIDYKYAESIDLILKSIVQVLSTINQCNNDRRYYNLMS